MKTHVVIRKGNGSETVVPISSLSLSKSPREPMEDKWVYKWHNPATSEMGGYLNEEQYLHLIDILGVIET